jgi:hypothetical protein
MHPLLITLLLTACASNSQEAPPQDPAAEEAPATPQAAAPEAEDPAAAEVTATKTEEPTAPTTDADGWTLYGAAFTQTESISAGTLLAEPDTHVGKTVRVSGRVADVCQKQGCWMVVTDQDKSMRVIMKDHTFSVAKDGTGSTCEVEGEVVSKPIDPKEVEHFASESANKDAMPETSAAGGVTYELVATSVRMRPAEG